MSSASAEPHAPNGPNDNHAIAVLERIKTIDATPEITYANHDVTRHVPSPSLQRKTETLNETPFDVGAPAKDGVPHEAGKGQDPDTVFYLAYGSNLCAKTFQGKRGIRPLSQANVVVPELVMTFDLSALPYLEPCFANTRYRVQNGSVGADENAPLLSDVPSAPRYRKTEWQKGLVGVAYEVTAKDYAHIMATEGGGSSYQDILVDCYELPAGQDTVPLNPTSPPFKAHTLYSPTTRPGQPRGREGGRASRPDPNYAQASRRYLNLLITGADEHALPKEYQEYLRRLRPYVVTTRRQVVGRIIFMMFWLPFIFPLFGLNRIFGDKQGRSPPWLRGLLQGFFEVAWKSYDTVFKPIFGDGERTMGGDEDELDRKVE
ncbi:hypothetical protein MMC07_006960 [Pseudocyphellaria aurata]|nr:hypothetical protein [Pseudocyphellaria aurata]